MKIRTKSNIYLVLSLLLCLLLILLPFCAAFINKTVTNYPKVISGRADFSDSSPKHAGYLYLSGEWEYFEGHIISGEALSEKSYKSIPLSFFVDLSHFLQQKGSYASYRLTISNLEFQNAVLYIPHFAGSYSVYINGELTGQNTDSFSSGGYSDKSARLTAVNFEKDREYTVVIEVSCDMMPGIYMTPVISDGGYDNLYTDIAMTFRSLIVGVVLFCAAFTLIYSVRRAAFFASKWLPLLFVLIAVRMMISTEGFTAFGFLFSSVSYEFITLVICISTFIIKLVALLFYTETLDLKIGKNTFIAFCTTFMLCALITSFFPYTVFNPYFYTVLQAATLPLDIILLSRLTDCAARKVPYATTYTLGYIAIFSGIMVDCLYTNGLIPMVMSSFMPVVFGLFVITFTIIFSRKLTSLYSAALKAAELDKELTAANTAIMISQIQPHFLYNALNTIKILIKRNPQKAEKAVVAFSKYLRGNMDSISQKTPIPFKTELEHIKNYCDIELMRFEDKLKIVYDTEYTNFYVPALSVQPIVENAIKHGVTKKAEGGQVTISSFEKDGFDCVVIKDDGVGFDMGAGFENTGSQSSHIGIKNVSGRLKTMMNAQLIIESVIGEGTTVTIKIPKGEKDEGLNR